MQYNEARCLLCPNGLAPGELFIMVRMADPADGRLVTPENRAGVIHLSHLQNIFTPGHIQTRVIDTSYMGPAGSSRVEVMVPL